MELTSWENFSTNTVLPSQRIHRWNDYGSDTLCNMTVDPANKECFNATLSRIEFGPLGLISLRSTGATASSGRGHVSDWATSERDALVMVLPEQGHCVSRQNNSECYSDPGSIFFQDLTHPWAFGCDDMMHLLIVKIPYSALLSRMEDPTSLLGKTFLPNRPAVAMAADIIRATEKALRAMPNADCFGAMSSLILDTVCLLSQSSADAREITISQQERAALRRAAMSYILHHLDDFELSIGSVAEALNTGERRLQRAFCEIGVTPIQFILTQRLDWAARKLRKFRGQQRDSILSVALSVGFNDASHFSRTFTRRYGVSPRQYRGTPPL